MGMHEFEELLGCPREHLEFTLWYLRENGLVTKFDNGRYGITVKGVDHTEEGGLRRRRQLENADVAEPVTAR